MARYWKSKPMSEAKKSEIAARSAKLDAIAERLSNMDEKEREALLVALGGQVMTTEGHLLSPRNSLLIRLQRPNENIVMVGGYNQLEARGFQVNSGEKAMSICIPKTGTKKDDKTGETHSFLRGFTLKAVMFSLGQCSKISETIDISENAVGFPIPQQSMALVCV